MLTLCIVMSLHCISELYFHIKSAFKHPTANLCIINIKKLLTFHRSKLQKHSNTTNIDNTNINAFNCTRCQIHYLHCLAMRRFDSD